MPAAAVYDIAQSADPIKTMRDKIGDLSKFEMAGGRVLVWIYIASERTTGGIIRPSQSLKEDIWQGTVGYVLKAGPFAFKDDESQKISFGGFKADVGDWVLFTPGEGKRVQINGVDCRIIEDSLIQSKIPSPDCITHSK